MLNPTITTLPQITLAGMTFFGDPFHSHSGWTEENEIGRGWQRLTAVYDTLAKEDRHNVDERVWYELHLEHPGSIEKGEWEVFVGYGTDQADSLPIELCVKTIPAHTWAVFTLKGSDVDTFDHLYKDWLKKSDYEETFPLLIERYDERFKGTDQMAESEFEYLIPVRKRSE